MYTLFFFFYFIFFGIKIISIILIHYQLISEFEERESREKFSLYKKINLLIDILFIYIKKEYSKTK